MEDKVKVRIRPFRGIGGVGHAGDVVWLPRADAEQYVKDGYVEILAVSDQRSAESEEADLTLPEEVEDHAIVKPEAKRMKAKGNKKK